MHEITFEQLPKAFTLLFDEVVSIKQLLLEKSNEQPPQTVQWFDLDGLCNYHPDKPSKPTVYGWVHTGSIPCHKGKKKLRFLKSEIDNWLKHGKQKTNAEIEAEANGYLTKKKGLNYGK